MVVSATKVSAQGITPTTTLTPTATPTATKTASPSPTSVSTLPDAGLSTPTYIIFILSTSLLLLSGYSFSVIKRK